jgi:integrase/recombinase XerD
MAQNTQSVSPLRQRMLDDMCMRKLSPKTQIGYVRAVARLANYLKYSLTHSPASASAEELRLF